MPKIKIGEAIAQRREEKNFTTSGGFTEEVVSFFTSEHRIDVMSEFNKLKSIGAIPVNQITDRMTLLRELNACHQNARRANLIFLVARKERELFRIEVSRAMRDLTRKATLLVEKWLKSNDVGRKQITKELVEQEIASDPELQKAYRALMEKEQNLVNIKEDCELLAREWSQRQWTLRAQASILTSEREVILKGESQN
jgi:hypothetical protein